jgi:prolyl-tRNA synthetase
VNLGRDCATPGFADVRLARVGEAGPRTGAPLVERRGIEVGHIFKLGTKYSAAMGATFAGPNGKPSPFVMGCYGIGVSRVAAAAVEQRSDDRGIVWPIPIAPFEVVVAPLKIQDDAQRTAAEALYEALGAAGVDVLLDDRKMGAGAKLKDSELMGFSIMVVVGRGLAADGTVEVRNRTTDGEKVSVPVDDVADLVVEMVRVGRRGGLPAE